MFHGTPLWFPSSRVPCCVRPKPYLLPKTLNLKRLVLLQYASPLTSCSIGKLDAKQPAALRILSAFGGTYRNRSPSEVHDTLTTLFDDVTIVPVTKAVSSGPPLDTAKHAELLALVKEGFSKGKFSDGSSEALPASWETELRALLQQEDVQVRVPFFPYFLRVFFCSSCFFRTSLFHGSLYLRHGI